MTPFAISSDRRRANRRRVLLAARLSGGKHNGTECMVRSISDTGALVRAPLEAPVSFTLSIERDGAVKRVRTIWRAGELRGVTFEPMASKQNRSAGRPVSPVELRNTVRLVIAQ